MRTTALVFTVMALAAYGQTRIPVHAHRGARVEMPENTIPAFERAMEVASDWIELDTAVTKDNVVVVSHDPIVNRKFCAGPEGEARIRFLTLDEVKKFDCGAKADPAFPRQKAVPGAWMPTLDESLALLKKGESGFNIEVKSDPKKPDLYPDPASYAKLVVDAIRRHKAEKRVQVQSFDFRIVIEVKKIAPELRLCALYGGMPKDFVEISKEAGGVPYVAPNYILVTKENVAAAHKAGLKVIPWTVNSVEAWDRLIEAGVDEIITDDPAGLIAHLKAKGRR
ncbi:MAG: glycerophosphodiester phosphodiesterase [Candidatus Solibacter sp.]|nr:glycerophosphodiester phosphodiesterase [Candidatus Solibacter sp.]